MLREQMAPTAWSAESASFAAPLADVMVPPLESLSAGSPPEVDPFIAMSEAADREELSLDEASPEADLDEPEEVKNFPAPVQAPQPSQMYSGRPAGAGGPTFQAQGFNRARASMPASPGMMAGGAVPAPAAMRAMKMNAFAASETSPVEKADLDAAADTMAAKPAAAGTSADANDGDGCCTGPAPKPGARRAATGNRSDLGAH